MLTSTETSVQLAAALLLGGGLIALLSGGFLLSLARRHGSFSYVRLRRQTILRAWKNIVWGVGLLLAAGLMLSFGPALFQAVTGAEPAPPPAATAAQLTAPAAAANASATLTISPAATLTAPPPTLTPTPNLTPVLPLDRITPPAEPLTVTPPANAVVANLRLSRFNDCASQRGVAETFTTPGKPLYALFDYDSWLPGMAWTSVWRRAGDVVHVETLLWDGSTGGCGFTNFDNAGQAWPEGAYEVQLFVGEVWLGSAAFTIFDRTPTPAATP